VMVLTVKALEHSNVVIEVIAGAASYLSFLFVMRVFDREDIMYLRALIRKEVTSV